MCGAGGVYGHGYYGHAHIVCAVDVLLGSFSGGIAIPDHGACDARTVGSVVKVRKNLEHKNQYDNEKDIWIIGGFDCCTMCR